MEEQAGVRPPPVVDVEEDDDEGFVGMKGDERFLGLVVGWDIDKKRNV